MGSKKERRDTRGLRIVSVSSSSKNSGKTTLSAYLIRELGAEFALKVCRDRHAPPVTADPGIIREPGTDTRVLSEAGAEKVVWASSETDEGLARATAEALALFPRGGTLVVEGNSALDHLSPDFAVFIMSADFTEFKPSAFAALDRAGLVLLDLRWNFKGRKADDVLRELKERAPGTDVIAFSDGRGFRDAMLETARRARQVLQQAA